MNFAIHNELLHLAQVSMDNNMDALNRAACEIPIDWADLYRDRGRTRGYLDAAQVYREEEKQMLIDSNITEILQARLDKLEKALDAEQAEEEPDAQEIAYIDGQMEAYYKAIKLIKSAERATEEG